MASEEAQAKLQEVFLKLTGYKKSDVLGINVATRKVVTKDGGINFVSRNGKELLHRGGPLPPKTTDVEAATPAVEEQVAQDTAAAGDDPAAEGGAPES